MPNWTGRRITEHTLADRQRSVVARVQRQEGRSITAPALAQVRPRQWFGADNGIQPDGTADNSAAFAALIAKMQPGDELVLESGNVRSNSPIVLDRRMTLRGGATLTTGNVAAEQIRIAAGGVTVAELALPGVGAGTYRAASYGIRIAGQSVAAMIDGVTLRGLRFSEQAGHAVWADYAANIAIEDCRVERFARDAFMFLSCNDIWVSRILAKDATMAAGTLAYGVAFTRDTTKLLADAPQSTNFHVDNSEFRNIGWEGSDTHAGQHGWFTRNRYYNCLQPIAIVSGNDQVGAAGGAYGPKYIHALYNYMESGVSNGTQRAGVVVQGAGPLTAGSVLDPATGCEVVGNHIIGHGIENSSTQGGIIGVRTDRLLIAENDLDQCAVNAIVMQNDNKTFRIADNHARDMWTNSTVLNPSAVAISSTYNTGFITGTVTSRGSKTVSPGRVNQRGISSVADPTNVIDLGKNPLRDVVQRLFNVTE